MPYVLRKQSKQSKQSKRTKHSKQGKRTKHSEQRKHSKQRSPPTPSLRSAAEPQGATTLPENQPAYSL